MHHYTQSVRFYRRAQLIMVFARSRRIATKLPPANINNQRVAEKATVGCSTKERNQKIIDTRPSKALGLSMTWTTTKEVHAYDCRILHLSLHFASYAHINQLDHISSSTMHWWTSSIAGFKPCNERLTNTCLHVGESKTLQKRALQMHVTPKCNSNQ